MTKTYNKIAKTLTKIKMKKEYIKCKTIIVYQLYKITLY